MKIDDFVRCITKKFFYSFCGIIFFSNITKFSASNEKMFHGERFITRLLSLILFNEL